MMSKQNRITACAHQAGFSLVSAIFLLVVVAALGAFSVTLSTNQQQSEALDVLGARAYQAARSGIEWGAFQIVQSQVSPAFVTACQAGATAASFVPAATTLSKFNVTVSCNAKSFVEPQDVVIGGVTTTIHTAASPLWIYQLNVVAVANTATVGTPGYVERQIGVSIAQ